MLSLFCCSVEFRFPFLKSFAHPKRILFSFLILSPALLGFSSFLVHLASTFDWLVLTQTLNWHFTFSYSYDLRSILCLSFSRTHMSKCMCVVHSVYHFCVSTCLICSQENTKRIQTIHLQRPDCHDMSKDKIKFVWLWIPFYKWTFLVLWTYFDTSFVLNFKIET